MDRISVMTGLWAWLRLAWCRMLYSGSGMPMTAGFHMMGRPALSVRMKGTSFPLMISTMGSTSSRSWAVNRRLATPESSSVVR
ncbi:hypothetical protein CSA17_03085 [bacterium DOLJORAL78_65_58]|nr:MAG: hypothetical protein CSA17_03085 [bacterium DOLJORAL78_65_58]